LSGLEFEGGAALKAKAKTWTFEAKTAKAKAIGLETKAVKSCPGGLRH